MQQESECRERVAVITGAASGIGLAVAERAAALGMRVVLSDISEPDLAAQVKRLCDGGAEAIGVPADVSSRRSVEELAAAAEATFGPVWLLMNNAGVSLRLRTWDISPSDWDWVVGVNLFGVIHGLDTFLPGMLDRNAGHIVNTASMAGLVVAAGSSAAYAATKHAVIGLSEVLFRELSRLGASVGVSVLCPGAVSTNIALAGLHRPARFGAPALPDAAYDSALHATNSLHPSEVAEEVFKAIDRQQFWILTHKNTFGGPLHERAVAMLAGRNPDERSADPAISQVAWHPGSRRVVTLEDVTASEDDS